MSMIVFSTADVYGLNFYLVGADVEHYSQSSIGPEQSGRRMFPNTTAGLTQSHLSPQMQKLLAKKGWQ